MREGAAVPARGEDPEVVGFNAAGAQVGFEQMHCLANVPRTILGGRRDCAAGTRHGESFLGSRGIHPGIQPLENICPRICFMIVCSE
jgi:hypothetical protein